MLLAPDDGGGSGGQNDLPLETPPGDGKPPEGDPEDKKADATETPPPIDGAKIYETAYATGQKDAQKSVFQQLSQDFGIDFTNKDQVALLKTTLQKQSEDKKKEDESWKQSPEYQKFLQNEMALRYEREQFERSKQDHEITNTLVALADKHKAVNARNVAVLIKNVGDVRLSYEGGAITLTKPDGSPLVNKDGVPMTLDQYVGTYLAANPELIKSDVVSGTRTTQLSLSGKELDENDKLAAQIIGGRSSIEGLFQNKTIN
jgi:hypothetical protein